MPSPWNNFEPEMGILDVDMDGVREYEAQKRGKEFKIMRKLIPEPFLGNIESAPLLLLGGNPGFHPDDCKWHSGEEFRAAAIENLKGNKKGIYLLEARFQESPGAQWWRRRLGCLCKEIARQLGMEDLEKAFKILSRGTAIVEQHPYHTKKFSLPKALKCLPSFEFVKEMIEEAVEENRFVIIVRSHKIWKERVRLLNNPERENIIETRHIQSAYLTPRKFNQDAEIGYEEIQRLAEYLIGVDRRKKG